jgi:aarF domain-containing kinase
MPKSKIPQSTFARASRLFWSGAKIAAREVSERIGGVVGASNSETALLTKIKQTQDLVNALSQLKGAAMKAGQLLSLEFSDLLPVEVVDVLRTLHDNGSSMPLDQVRYILARELTRERLSELEDLSTNPVAAASIGQVHRAILRGSPVAVKIQFPGVASTIDSDLAALANIAKTITQVRGKNINFDDFFQDLAISFKKEADYRAEAQSVDQYRNKMRSDSYVIPRVFHEFSSEKVLTLSFEEGIRINDWIKSRPSREESHYFGALLINLLIDEFFTFGLVQTDPNYGNFLYRPDQRQIVLLDFGATTSYEPSFRQEIRHLFKVMASKDQKKLIELILDYGFLDRREPTEVLDLFIQMLDRVVKIFSPQVQPFRFNDDQYLKEIREISVKFVMAVQFSPPAKKLALLNRKLGGIFHLLKDLGVEMDMRPFVDRVLNAPIEE